MKAKRFVVPLILALGLAAISGLALDWDLGAASALRRFFTNATVSQPESAAWRFHPDDTGKLLRSHPEDFVYLELIEENSDTFAEQLFKADPPSLPAPFVFQDGLSVVHDSCGKSGVSILRCGSLANTRHLRMPTPRRNRELLIVKN